MTRPAKLDAEVEEVENLLNTAEEYLGDLFSDYEQDFILANLKEIRKQGSGYNLTPAREDILERIKKKLNREGLL